MATKVSEEVVSSLVNSLNADILKISDIVSYVGGSSEIIESIEDLSDLWSTAGGASTIGDTLYTAEPLEKNKLGQELGSLSNEKVSYTKTTVTK